MAWITQGPIADRSIEMLGTTDRGVTIYRNMLRRELKRVEAGEDPMNVFRADNVPETMELPLERLRMQNDQGGAVGQMQQMFTRHEVRYCPVGRDVVVPVDDLVDQLSVVRVHLVTEIGAGDVGHRAVAALHLVR